MRFLLLLLLLSTASAEVLGDNPEFLMNTLGYNLLETFGGQDAGIVLGLVLFCVLAYLALIYRLDRGALTYLGVLVIGLLIYFNALPETAWWIMIIAAAAMATMGLLNILKQGVG